MYTQWFLNLGHGRFAELNKADDCNSHRRMLGTYQCMLAAWRKMDGPQEMTKEQIQALSK